MTNADSIYSFIVRKIKILDNDEPYSRAMCAKLRRAIGKHPGATPDIWEITMGEAPDNWSSHKGKPTLEEWAVHTTLSLYALHRQGKNRSMNQQGQSLGTAIGQLARDENKLKPIQRRFSSMATSTEFTELAYHARGLVQLLKAEDIPMDYPSFAKDLFWFQIPGYADPIRLRWGEDFYKTINKAERTDEK